VAFVAAAGTIGAADVAVIELLRIVVGATDVQVVQAPRQGENEIHTNPIVTAMCPMDAVAIGKGSGAGGPQLVQILQTREVCPRHAHPAAPVIVIGEAV
jgi:hypothetical protein